VSRLKAELLALRSPIVAAQAKPAAIAPTSPPSWAPPENPSSAAASSKLRTPPRPIVLVGPVGWNSEIVPDFPKLFEDFNEEQFALLWRGSRDGFRAKAFHSRCDGHPNTLTVILDKRGNIFGGFTPVEWESDSPKNPGKWKADPSLESFLFTLKNPHNVPARTFALKAEKKDEAILCRSDYGPRFGDIVVSDNCNANTDSGTSRFGDRYTNETGLDHQTFFTGSLFFKVKEIEVFEITD
jgi:hypothetical protein